MANDNSAELEWAKKRYVRLFWSFGVSSEEVLEAKARYEKELARAEKFKEQNNG